MSVRITVRVSALPSMFLQSSSTATLTKIKQLPIDEKINDVCQEIKSDIQQFLYTVQSKSVLLTLI